MYDIRSGYLQDAAIHSALYTHKDDEVVPSPARKREMGRGCKDAPSSVPSRRSKEERANSFSNTRTCKKKMLWGGEGGQRKMGPRPKI